LIALGVISLRKVINSVCYFTPHELNIFYSEFRQDMGGVGGFIRENRTLYVGRIAISSDTENVVRRQFGQFGPLERGKE
jgi:RNA recognition motif-containing protein